MLLIFHSDKNDTSIESFLDEEIRVQLRNFPKPNTWVKLRMVGYSNETEGGPVYLSFPDLLPNEILEEEKNFGDAFLQPGVISLAPDEGGFANAASRGQGRFTHQADNRDMDLMLGRMDPQKDTFRVVVDARRGRDVQGKTNLNNFSCVLEMIHGSSMG